MRLRKPILATFLLLLCLACLAGSSYGAVVLQGPTVPTTVAEWTDGSPEAATIGNAIHPGWVTAYGSGTTLNVSTLTLGDAGGSWGTLSLWNDAQLNTAGNITATNGVFNLDLSATTAGTAPIQVGGTFDISNAALSLTQNGVTPSGTYNLVNGTVSGVFGKWIGRTYIGQYANGGNILVGDRVGQINYGASSATVGTFGAAITDITVDPEGWGNLADVYYGADENAATAYSGEASVTRLYVGKQSGGTATDPHYGELLIAGGKTITCATGGYLGYSAGNAGKATVTGSGSTWTVLGSGFFEALYVGDAGSGALIIADGGNVNNHGCWIADDLGSDGEVLVTGSGSTWTLDMFLIIGNEGSGSLTIADGGSIDSDHDYIGFEASGVSEVLVTGSGSTWTNEALYGKCDNGSLTIADGGTITTATDGCISFWSSNDVDVLVTGNGSTWTIGDELSVGYYGTSLLTINDGGNVTTTAGFIANQSNSDGTVLVADSGSTWTIGDKLYVGKAGSGSMTIANGGNVSTGTNAYLGYRTGSNGTVLVTGSGSTWTIDGDLCVGYNGSGSLTIANGGKVVVGGTIQMKNLWKLTAGDNPHTLLSLNSFALGTKDAFTTLSDCIGANSLNFGASTGGTININHQATIAALNAASTSAFVIGTTGKLVNTVALDMRNASGITINIAAGDFIAGRIVADLAASSWMVNPTKVTLNVEAATGAGSVTLATSTGAPAISTDGTTEITQAALDSWIDELSGAYSIGYDGFDLLLNCTDKVAPGDSNKTIIDKLILGGSIVLPPGMTSQDVLTSMTTTTGCTLTGLNAAREFGSTLAARMGSIGSLTNNTLRGQQVLRNYRRGKSSLWMENVGAWTNQDAIDATITGYNASLYGIQLGADRLLGRNLIAGVSFAGAWANTRSEGQKMATDIFDLQLYGAWRMSRKLRATGSVGYQYMDYTGMFLGENSSHVGNMFKLAGEMKYDIQLGRTLVTPIYGWEYYTTKEDAYETGQFAVDGNTTEAIYQRCGVRIALLKRHRVKVELHTSWLHNFGDENIIFSAASGGTPFQLTGAPLHRDLGEVGLDITIALHRQLDLTLGYLGVYANGFDTQSVNGLLRWSF